MISTSSTSSSRDRSGIQGGSGVSVSRANVSRSEHGSVPRAVPGITVGHEMVGIVDEVGEAVTAVRPGDRVTVNVETFCGDCFFCRNGWVNNCTDPEGGWALGCRIDGGQAEYVRVPYADQGLNRIPDGVTDRQALFVGDVLATGYWAARIAEIRPGDTVLILGAGPTGLCTLQCVQLLQPGRIIVCDRDPGRLAFVRAHAPQVLAVPPEGLPEVVRANSRHGGADAVLEVAGSPDTFRLAWECARPNAVVTVVALYDEPQTLPLPRMYGKNLTFKPCRCRWLCSFAGHVRRSGPAGGGQIRHCGGISAVSTGDQIMQTALTIVITGLAMGITVLLGQKIGGTGRRRQGGGCGQRHLPVSGGGSGCHSGAGAGGTSAGNAHARPGGCL